MPRSAIWALLAVATVAGSGCGDFGLRPHGDGSDGGEGTGPARAVSEGRDPVAGRVAALPTSRKVAQLMLVGLEGAAADGAVLSDLERLGYGGLVLDSRNQVSAGQAAGLVDAALSAARKGDQVVPWVMASQEGGDLNALPDLPPEKAPAEIRAPREAGEIAEDTAAALDELGVTGILAPVLDVAPASGGPVEGGSYSDVPERVAGYGRATIEAFEDAGMFSAAKHFPGLGGASQSTDLGPAAVGLTLEQLEERDLVPFRAAIETGAPGLVVGHGLYGVEDFVTPASTSETIVTDLLRDDLGFEGVAIADDLTAPAITASFTAPAAAVDAVRAGVDLVYVSGGGEPRREVYEALLAAVREGTITAARLDEALTRTLDAKRELGLLETGERAKERG